MNDSVSFSVYFKGYGTILERHADSQTRLFQGDDAAEFESRVSKARTDVFDSLCAEYFCSLRAESF